jgi:hypothetical protein
MFCATANPTNVIGTETDHDSEIDWRKDLRQRIGHHL